MAPFIDYVNVAAHSLLDFAAKAELFSDADRARLIETLRAVQSTVTDPAMRTLLSAALAFVEEL